MMAGTIVQEIEIKAAPERIFEALTNPTQLQAWWGSDDTYRITDCSVDLRVGGKWRSAGRGQDGSDFDVHGEYREIDRPRVLVYTWNPSWERYETTVRFELTPTPLGTHLKVTHTGFRTDDVENVHEKGWGMVLGLLLAYAESNA
jgi:uncharacterized protein YndB with AHSA1/START domain